MLDLRNRSRLGLAVGVLLALLLLLPLLGPGFVLVRDMVFVPRAPLGGQLLGLDAVPRGTPSDLLVTLAGRVVPSGWLQDGVLLALVIAGAWGAGRLAPTTRRAGVLAAATSYGWSPYLHERLLLGQWALLVGWAVLPWAVRAALDWRRGAPGWWAVGALAVAACAGANALLLVGLAVVVCGRPVRAAAATAVLALPWLLPGVLQHVVAGDPRGVSAFAANSDSPFGVVGSLLTGGGVWSRDAVPAGRAAGATLALLAVVVAAVGLRRLQARLGPRLPALALLGLVLALLGRVPGLSAALRWAVVHVPATGVLRDGQKWIAPVVLLTSAALACGIEVLLERVSEQRTAHVIGGLLALLPLAALPGAAWGEGGRLHTSSYPAGFVHLTERADGAVLVLPWSLYRAFPWTHGETVLDPATKLLRRPVVNDALPLPTGVVRGEDPLAARLDADVRSGAPLQSALRAAGVEQVLVERTTAGFDPITAARQVQGMAVLGQTHDLVLYDVGDPAGPADPLPDRAPLAPVVAGDLLAAAFALLAARHVWQLRGTWTAAP
ncbi:MAG: hypothetical protein QOJ48_325 [Frankiales bacterium]|nr:hypothetical protein [Frankiales bacterium]